MRDGKASRAMIERYHGKDVFQKPALDQIVTASYRKAASEYPEEIYYTPTVRVEQHEAGRDLCFTAQVQIRPEVRLGDYRAAQLQPPPSSKTTPRPICSVPRWWTGSPPPATWRFRKP